MLLIYCGFIIHLIFLGSIFDIYFKSPIVHDVPPHSSPLPPPAQRLVLFVADGLRADSFYDVMSNRSHTPYLRHIIQNIGSWGFSHTRVPTESRPGHVAIIAGFYEDPSAVTKGWKENPVEFDSVFNQSRYTWSWGSPDILPMFAKGASGDHVWTEMYTSDFEDFSGKKSTTVLDNWVFDKFEMFLKKASSDPLLLKKLNEDKVVFFLHLLGLDTAGHTHKPHSQEYLDNIHVVDKGVKKVVDLIGDFYGYDNQTSFIFTSDHGMTAWGSHGSGDRSETETPLVAWGAGVTGPALATSLDPTISSRDWEVVAHLKHKNVSQVDIAPLMATLIGINIPVNSVGFLPQSYLNMSKHQLAEAVFANGRQMAAQYDQKRAVTEQGTISSLYRPFAGLTQEKQISTIQQIQQSIHQEKISEAIVLSEELIKASLAGLDYYQNYYQCLLLGCMTLSFLGWITLLLVMMIAKSDSKLPFLYQRKNSHLIKNKNVATNLYQKMGSFICIGNPVLEFFFTGVVILTVFLIYVQSLPLQFYVYCLLPELLWWVVARQYSTVLSWIRRARHSHSLRKILGLFVIYVMGTELLVLSFFYRWVLSVGMVGLALWPMLGHTDGRYWLVTLWMLSCALLAIFPLLPVVGRDPNPNQVVLSSCMWLLFTGFFTSVIWKHEEQKIKKVCLLQICLSLAVIWNLKTTGSSITDKQGLLTINQVISWTVLGFSVLLPALGSRRILPRLLSISVALAEPFLLLSAAHEGLFLLALASNLFFWLLIEVRSGDSRHTKLSIFAFATKAKADSKPRSLTSSDVRRAYVFLYYIILSFFGTGNIASINSFDPTWVRCFLTVFSPFIMTSLIVWKTLVPFLTVTCTFRTINTIVLAPTKELFLVVLVFCDVMGLHFLHLVTNRGSWLDIGTSISHYVIMQAITLFLVLLYSLAYFLTACSLWPVVDVIIARFSHQHARPTTPDLLPDLNSQTSLTNQSCRYRSSGDYKQPINDELCAKTWCNST